MKIPEDYMRIEDWYDILSNINEGYNVKVKSREEVLKDLLLETYELTEDGVPMLDANFHFGNLLALLCITLAIAVAKNVGRPVGPIIAIPIAVLALGAWAGGGLLDTLSYPVRARKSTLGVQREGLTESGIVATDLNQLVKTNSKARDCFQQLCKELGESKAAELVTSIDSALKKLFKTHPEFLQVDPEELKANETQIINQIAAGVQTDINANVLANEPTPLSEVYANLLEGRFLDRIDQKTGFSLMLTVELVGYTALAVIALLMINSSLPTLPLIVVHLVVDVVISVARQTRRVHFRPDYRKKRKRRREAFEADADPDFSEVPVTAEDIEQLFSTEPNLRQEIQQLSDIFKEKTSMLISSIAKQLEQFYAECPDFLKVTPEELEANKDQIVDRATQQVEQKLKV